MEHLARTARSGGEGSSTHRRSPETTATSPAEPKLPPAYGAALPPAPFTSPCSNIVTNEATGGGFTSQEPALFLQPPRQPSSPARCGRARGHRPLIAAYWEEGWGQEPSHGAAAARGTNPQAGPVSCRPGLSEDHPDPTLLHLCCSKEND